MNCRLKTLTLNSVKLSRQSASHFLGEAAWLTLITSRLLARYFPYPFRPALGPTQPPIQGYISLYKRPRRGVNHPPPSIADVKEGVEVYLYSPSVPSLQAIGWTNNNSPYSLHWYPTAVCTTTEAFIISCYKLFYSLLISVRVLCYQPTCNSCLHLAVV
jgi:hypothetical protein